jgi:hypothetical protein
MGRADGEAPNAEVDGYSRSAQVCYPRVDFSDSSTSHQERLGGSLSPTFVPENPIVRNSVRLPFGFALCGGVLTLLRQPLGPDDFLSSGCRPSRTAHQLRSPMQWGKCRKPNSVVLQICLHPAQKRDFEGSHIRCATQSTTQQQAAVKRHGVSMTR